MADKAVTILLVDDDNRVRQLAELMLRSAGYEVHTAASASEAITAVERLQCGVNLLVTDMVMPDTDGHQLIGVIRQICPHVGALVISGFVPEDRPDRDYPILRKPFTKGQLIAAVKQALDTKN
jgi:CheY-like chemotaxis protein